MFGAWLTAGLWALAAVLAGWRGSLARWVGVVLALSLAAPVSLVEYRLRVDTLRATIDRGGPEALTVRDRAGIWVLNLGMAAGGLCAGFPEVALETLLLAVPGPPERRFRSGFAGGSPKVRAVIEGYRGSLRGEGPVRLPPRVVRWGLDGGHAEWRRGLALDAFTITGVAVREGDVWRLDLEGRVPVDYHGGYRLPLVPGLLWIDETLYDALERRGDLHPYTAVWVWSETVSAR